jgi:hypothetical protein
VIVVNTDLGFRPHVWQQQMRQVMRRSRYSVHVIHRRGGKTRFMVNTLADAALKYPNIHDTPGRFSYVAPLLKQAKDAAWFYLKGISWKLNASNGTREANRRTWFCKTNESELSLEFRHNGARVKLYGGSDPDSVRGIYCDGAAIDEPGQQKAILWTEVMLPMLQDHDGWAAFIGTPKGINFFHKLYFQDALNPGWDRVLIRASQTSGTLSWLSPEKLEQLQRDMSDIKYAQEMECDFNASAEDVLVTINDVIAAQERTVARESELQGLVRVLGIDLARYRDRSVMVKRWGRLMYEPVVWKGGTNHMDIVQAIAHEIMVWKPDAVFIDKAQAGTVIDLLEKLGHGVIAIDFGGKPANPHYLNKRAEMYATMAQWVREVGVLPKNADLLTELTSVTYDFDLSDKFRLESKDTIRERLAEQELPSPDIADALALTFAMPVRPRSMDDFQAQILQGAGVHTGSVKDWKPSWQK